MCDPSSLQCFKALSFQVIKVISDVVCSLCSVFTPYSFKASLCDIPVKFDETKI